MARNKTIRVVVPEGTYAELQRRRDDAAKIAGAKPSLSSVAANVLHEGLLVQKPSESTDAR